MILTVYGFISAFLYLPPDVCGKGCRSFTPSLRYQYPDRMHNVLKRPSVPDLVYLV